MITDKPSGVGLEKAPTGIQGLDEIIFGGLPRGRPTLVAGAAGSGKTTLAMQFLVNGALNYNEPGVFVAFEESTSQIIRNMRSIGMDLEPCMKQGLLRFPPTAETLRRI